MEKGKTRIRWRCACGRNMYDDFTELRPGAAAELEKWLNHSMRNHAVSGPSNPSSTATLRSSVSPNAPNSGHQQTAESDIALQRRIDALGGFSGDAATTLDVHLEKCWLLVCGKTKRGPDSLLTQLDLSHTPSDKNLFIEMRNFYSNLRNSWGLRPFLRGVRTIRFVQVNISMCDGKDSRSRADYLSSLSSIEWLGSISAKSLICHRRPGEMNIFTNLAV